MTAALVLAAMDHGGIDLQLMAGTRADLAKTRDGTQEVTPARVEAVRFERSMVLALAAWSRFAYDAAVIGFDAFPVPFDKTLRQRRQRARMLSIAFALWDRFDHAAAFEHLRDYQPVLRPALSSSLAALQIMSATASATPHEHQRREGVRIWDLWLNAQRRAVAGRYDDAIARAYRMIEWTAQWVLESRKGWRTAEVPEKVAVSAGMTLGRDGKYQAGLYQAWSLVADHTDTAAARFFRESRIPMLQNLEVRNLSILAHGFRPVAGREWETLWAWLRDSFEPMLREELADAGVRDPFPQLPTSLPEDPSPVAQSLP
jgi:CRISPR-associated protein (TIGR02710 family)